MKLLFPGKELSGGVLRIIRCMAGGGVGVEGIGCGRFTVDRSVDWEEGGGVNAERWGGQR